jgi:hypothetical protein
MQLIFVFLPVVSLRSITGYKLRSLGLQDFGTGKLLNDQVEH